MDSLMELEVGKVKPSKTNPRKNFDDKRMKDLVESIKARGVIQPIVVRPQNGHFELVCGERRLRACKAAGIEKIPAWVRELDDKAALEVQVIENLQREDVHAMEEAEGYEQLIRKHGYTVDDLAVKIGKTASYVYQRMKLCDLSENNRKRFYEGKFNPSVALLVARIPANLQDEADRFIAAEFKRSEYSSHDEPMSYAKARAYIEEKLMTRLKGAPFDPKDAALCPKAGACGDCPKRTGNQKELFADVQGADICTDPACFKQKVFAHGERLIEKAKKLGRKIIDADEAKKLFPYRENELGYDAPFVKLKDKQWDGSKERPLFEILKGVEGVQDHIHVVMAPSGAVYELIPKAKLSGLMKEAGVKSNDPTSKNSTEASSHKAEKQRKELIKAENDRIIGLIVGEASADKSQKFNKAFCRMLMEHISYDSKTLFAKRINPDFKRMEDSAGDLINNQLSACNSNHDRVVLCLELLLCADLFAGSIDTEADDDPVLDMCKLYGINVKKEAAAAKAELESGKTAKAPAAKAPVKAKFNKKSK